MFTHRVQARRVVLALPARLALERIRYAPALSAAVSDALRDTPTWMATQAKSLSSHARPFWREAGQSGNAFVQHPQAVLGEVFDASPADPQGPGVLGGFSALPPTYRAAVSPVSLGMMVDSQWQQLFGPLAAQGQTVHQDWAREAMDLQRDSTARTPRTRRWPSRPTATPCCAVPSGRAACTLPAPRRRPTVRATSKGPWTRPPGSHAASTPWTLKTLRHLPRSRRPRPISRPWTISGAWVHLARQQALERYRSQIHQRLSTQRDDQLTQQALLACVEQVYSAALTELEALPPATPQGASDGSGRSPLTPAVLAAFSGWNKDLLDQALQFNRTSCALSNFPDEAQPSDDYLKVITRDLVAAWREFALGANEVLLARACTLA